MLTSHWKHCFVLLTDASQSHTRESEGCTASFTCDNGRTVDLCISLLSENRVCGVCR